MEISRRTRGPALASILAAWAISAGAALGRAPQTEDWEFGYSYLRLSIDGKQISNLVHDPKYTVPEAELDFYDLDTAKFVGKYEVRGIRVLSLENAAASACPMYDVTLSFRSIGKE
jgi:hypothetical protein